MMSINLRSQIFAFMLVIAACVHVPGRMLGQSSPATVCTSTEYHQFDFWIGDWEVFDVDDQKTASAHVRIESILNGCVLKETYAGAHGMNGQSLSIFDRTRGVWHQSWVTDHGQLLIIEGKLTDGSIVLSGTDKAPNGQDRLTRGTWIPQRGKVRETAVRSTDGGRTWQPWFDLIFRPATASHNAKTN
jgi:hypothetical protein